MPDLCARIDLRRPFTTADGLAAGVTRSALTGPAYRRLFTGVYVDASVPVTQRLLLEAALVLHPPGAFASHHSAARLHRLPVPDTAVQHVSVTSGRDRRRRTGLASHVATSDAEVTLVQGLPASTALQCFLDLAPLLDLVELVAVGDALLRRGLCSLAELRRACAGATGRGATAARRAASYVRAGVDSPMETRLRMLIVLAGLPEPMVNFQVSDVDGRLLYRFDLSWPGIKLAVEYDGQQHRTDLDQWDHDLTRREWMDRNLWRLIVVVARDLYQRPESTLQRIHEALVERGCPGVPRTLSDEWRAFFSTRG